jgi:hypothetical protein
MNKKSVKLAAAAILGASIMTNFLRYRATKKYAGLMITDAGAIVNLSTTTPHVLTVLVDSNGKVIVPL